jgi:hypothetical protein
MTLYIGERARVVYLTPISLLTRFCLKNGLTRFEMPCYMLREINPRWALWSILSFL